ncbi:hypothetical protein LJR027_003088 [Terrabacter sp. LjRoot27]|uniref:hypothetical protein n=1 Tax=Terrabacter sp. LjRoot27 TaxID=3342306 RepID=UPI003ECEC514
MNDLSPMSDLIADDLLLDRLAGRVDAGSEPVAGLLGALAAHADTPLPSRTGRRRIANKHRYLGAFAALAVAASGAGVAAAVTLPSNGPSQADRAAIVKKMDESARSGAPSALLSRLGLPQTTGTTQAKGLVLARADDGTIVLLPAAVVAARGRAAAAGTHGIPGVAGTPGGGPVANGNGQTGQTGTGQGGAGGAVVPGGTPADSGGTTAGGSQTGTPQATNNGKKPAAGTKGGKKPTPTPTSTPTATTDVVVPQTTLATTTPTAPTTKTRTTGPVKPRPTGGSGSSGGSESSTSGAASSVEGVVDTLTAPVVPTP